MGHRGLGSRPSAGAPAPLVALAPPSVAEPLAAAVAPAAASVDVVVATSAAGVAGVPLCSAVRVIQASYGLTAA